MKNKAGFEKLYYKGKLVIPVGVKPDLTVANMILAKRQPKQKGKFPTEYKLDMRFKENKELARLSK